MEKETRSMTEFAEVPGGPPDPGQHLFQVAFGYVLSSALYVVTEAGVADHLGAGPKTVAELAKATGRNAGEKTVGMPVFQYFAKNPGYSEIFNRAMTTMSAAVIPAALEAYDFGGIGVLVDVAGGHGEVLLSILRKYPQMRGILMDLDHVVAGAAPRLAAAGVADRVQTVAGDFFKA